MVFNKKYKIENRKFFILVIFATVICSCVKDDLSKISDNINFTQSFSVPIGSYSLPINAPQLSDTSNIGGSYGLYYFDNHPYTNTFEYFALPEEMFDCNLSDTTATNRIKSIEFSIVINNSFPTQVESQIYMVNANMLLIDQIFSPNSLLVSPSTIYIKQIPMSASQLENLKQTKYLLFQGIVYTTNSNNKQPAYFQSNNTLTVTLGVKINIQYNSKDL